MNQCNSWKHEEKVKNYDGECARCAGLCALIFEDQNPKPCSKEILKLRAYGSSILDRSRHNHLHSLLLLRGVPYRACDRTCCGPPATFNGFLPRKITGCLVGNEGTESQIPYLAAYV